MPQRHRSPRSPERRHGGRRAQQRPFLDLRRDEGFRVGEEVEYHSSSYQEWIEGKVLAIHSDGTLDLDVRERADPSKVRRVRRSPQRQHRSPQRRARAPAPAPAPLSFSRDERFQTLRAYYDRHDPARSDEQIHHTLSLGEFQSDSQFQSLLKKLEAKYGAKVQLLRRGAAPAPAPAPAQPAASGSGAHWEWRDDDGSWMPYERSESATLERDFAAGMASSVLAWVRDHTLLELGAYVTCC